MKLFSCQPIGCEEPGQPPSLEQPRFWQVYVRRLDVNQAGTRFGKPMSHGRAYDICVFMDQRLNPATGGPPADADRVQQMFDYGAAATPER